MDRHTDATKVLSFRVPAEHAEWVAAKAEEAGMSVNKALRLWLAQAVKDSE
jgi:predicted HicB family RNase H-like nuclease